MSEIPLSARPALRRYARLQYDEVRQKHLLLLPEAFLILNETSAAILALCDGHRTVADISTTLGERYTGVNPMEIVILLQRLDAKGLIDITEETP